MHINQQGLDRCDPGLVVWSTEKSEQEGQMKLAHIWQLLKQAAITAAATAFLCSIAALANAQTSFYQGKTVTIIQGRDPGGSGDLRTKAFGLGA